MNIYNAECLDVLRAMSDGSADSLVTDPPAGISFMGKGWDSDKGEGNTHPTVKSTALMEYLIRLITPPGGTVLDPFMGSGSTGKAAALQGFGFVGIEQSEEYFEIARKRLGVG